MDQEFFEAKSYNQPDDVTNQIKLLRGTPNASFNFIPCEDVEEIERNDFFHNASWWENHEGY